MTAKPTEIFHWASVGGDVVEPNSGRQDVGYIEGEMPPAPEANYLFKTVGEWLAWLNAAEVDFGTATVRADTLQIDGTVNGYLFASGDLKGTDLLHTAYHEIAVPYLSFEFDENGDPSVYNALGYLTGASGATLARAPLPFLKVDDVITFAQVFYNPNGGGSMQPKLCRMEFATGGISDVWAGSTDSTGAIIESQNSGAITHTVAAGYVYWLENLHSGAANRTLGGIVRFTRPS